MTGSPSAVVLTVGNEIVSGDVENTNASWLARRLGELGLEVRLLAAVRDTVDEIAAFLRDEADHADVVIVTGGLGGTPDDVTREGVAAAFGVPTEEIPELAGGLRERFGKRGLGDYAARWARLPRGAAALENLLGGAPGFVVANVYVLPGLPSEMMAMFETFADGFRGEPICAWRRRYPTGEGRSSPCSRRRRAGILRSRLGATRRFWTPAPRSRSCSSRRTPTRSARRLPGSRRYDRRVGG